MLPCVLWYRYPGENILIIRPTNDGQTGSLVSYTSNNMVVTGWIYVALRPPLILISWGFTLCRILYYRNPGVNLLIKVYILHTLKMWTFNRSDPGYSPPASLLTVRASFFQIKHNFGEFEGKLKRAIKVQVQFKLFFWPPTFSFRLETGWTAAQATCYDFKMNVN